MFSRKVTTFESANVRPDKAIYLMISSDLLGFPSLGSQYDKSGNGAESALSLVGLGDGSYGEEIELVSPLNRLLTSLARKAIDVNWYPVDVNLAADLTSANLTLATSLPTTSLLPFAVRLTLPALELVLETQQATQPFQTVVLRWDSQALRCLGVRTILTRTPVSAFCQRRGRGRGLDCSRRGRHPQRKLSAAACSRPRPTSTAATSTAATRTAGKDDSNVELDVWFNAGCCPPELENLIAKLGRQLVENSVIGDEQGWNETNVTTAKMGVAGLALLGTDSQGRQLWPPDELGAARAGPLNACPGAPGECVECTQCAAFALDANPNTACKITTACASGGGGGDGGGGGGGGDGGGGGNVVWWQAALGDHAGTRAVVRVSLLLGVGPDAARDLPFRPTVSLLSTEQLLLWASPALSAPPARANKQQQQQQRDVRAEYVRVSVGTARGLDQAYLSLHEVQLTFLPIATLPCVITPSPLCPVSVADTQAISLTATPLHLRVNLTLPNPLPFPLRVVSCALELDLACCVYTPLGRPIAGFP
eukprot:g39196.t1